MKNRATNTARPAKTVRILELRSKVTKTKHGKSGGQLLAGHKADITPGQSIRLHGVEPRRSSKTVEFDVTFRVGDLAEYHSYNLSYLGKILSITAKTVTIAEDGRKRRLDLYTFSWRNWEGVEPKQRRNNEYYHHH